MGKFAVMLSILIFIDMLFLVTGQIDLNSPLSIVSGAILDPSAFKTSVFFLLILGTAGIAGLIASSGVITGTLVSATNVLVFTAIAVALGGLLGDFITVYLTLRNYNEVLAIMIMAPIIMIFSLTIMEWLRGMDR